MKTHLLVKALVIILLSLGLLLNTSCKRENEELSSPTSFVPTNPKISSGEYSIKIQWDTIKSSSIKGYKIYRDTIPSPIKLLTETNIKCSFLDKLIIPEKRYYYRVSSKW
jgi:hypothetical protein